MSGKTIVAPASAPGRGGVSVIRMSGANSREIAENMCGSLADSWKFKKCNIKSLDGTVLDNGLVVFFKSPHSYTGEDVVELQTHGSRAVITGVLRALGNLRDLRVPTMGGCAEFAPLPLRPAERGEFTQA